MVSSNFQSIQCNGYDEEIEELMHPMFRPTAICCAAITDDAIIMRRMSVTQSEMTQGPHCASATHTHTQLDRSGKTSFFFVCHHHQSLTFHSYFQIETLVGSSYLLIRVHHHDIHKATLTGSVSDLVHRIHCIMAVGSLSTVSVPLTTYVTHSNAQEEQNAFSSILDSRC